MKRASMYFFLLILMGCAQKQAEEDSSHEATDIVSPVTITAISEAPMTEYLELNATSSYLQRNVVKANVNGYIQEIHAVLGKSVKAGDLLFTLKTKESESIGNAVNALDSSFKFSGIISIKAPQPGYISDVSHQVGDYVQDGEQLAITSDQNSFVFVLNLPYELRPYVLGKRDVLLTLPDGKDLAGKITSITPIVDSASQTQNVFISVVEKNIPVNVVARVRVEKNSKTNTFSLPKPAVLSDEMQNNFWVMKIIDSNTAVKIPITKGIENADRVEILSPKFSASDRFILNGNFGLPDTAKIKIVQQ